MLVGQGCSLSDQGKLMLVNRHLSNPNRHVSTDTPGNDAPGKTGVSQT